MQHPNTGQAAASPRLRPNHVPSRPAPEGAGRDDPGPIAPTSGYVPAAGCVLMTVRQPAQPSGYRTVTGILLGTMHDRGKVHHYRISTGGGMALLAPPHWVVETPPASVPEAVHEVRRHIQLARLEDILRELRQCTAAARSALNLPGAA